MATENGANGVPIDDQIEPTVIGNLSERHFIFWYGAMVAQSVAFQI